MKSWNLRSGMSSPKHWYLLTLELLSRSLHIVFFDVEYVKLRLRCQNIFSAARHLQFGNLRVPQRPGNGNPVKGCYVALFRTLDSANNATQSAFKCVENNGRRQGHRDLTRAFLCKLWVFGGTHGVRITPDETVRGAQRRVADFKSPR